MLKFFKKIDKYKLNKGASALMVGAVFISLTGCRSEDLSINLLKEDAFTYYINPLAWDNYYDSIEINAFINNHMHRLELSPEEFNKLLNKGEEYLDLTFDDEVLTVNVNDLKEAYEKAINNKNFPLEKLPLFISEVGIIAIPTTLVVSEELSQRKKR